MLLAGSSDLDGCRMEAVLLAGNGEEAMGGRRRTPCCGDRSEGYSLHATEAMPCGAYSDAAARYFSGFIIHANVLEGRGLFREHLRGEKLQLPLGAKPGFDEPLQEAVCLP